MNAIWVLTGDMASELNQQNVTHISEKVLELSNEK